MVEGRAAIQSAQQSMIDGGVQALGLEVVDIIEAGDLAIEIGRYTLTIRPPGREPVIDHGKSVVVWRCGSGAVPACFRWTIGALFGRPKREKPCGFCMSICSPRA
jgi:hypothetical protein